MHGTAGLRAAFGAAMSGLAGFIHGVLRWIAKLGCSRCRALASLPGTRQKFTFICLNLGSTLLKGMAPCSGVHSRA